MKTCPGKGLVFSKKKDLSVEGFFDADWAGSQDDRRSTYAYCTYLGGNLVTWRSKKQTVCARSSAEAEYRAMAQAVSELLWLRILLKDIGIQSPIPMKLYCDNKAAINIANNPFSMIELNTLKLTDILFVKSWMRESCVYRM